MASKSSISKSVSKKIDIPLNEANSIVEKFITLLLHNSKKKKIKISNFGTFSIHNTKRRVGRNPKTMESYIIRPMKKLAFNASKNIKNILN